MAPRTRPQMQDHIALLEREIVELRDKISQAEGMADRGLEIRKAAGEQILAFVDRIIQLEGDMAKMNAELAKPEPEAAPSVSVPSAPKQEPMPIPSLELKEAPVEPDDLPSEATVPEK